MSVTVRKRVSKKGLISYYAEVRIHQGPEVVARKSGTFPTLKEAREWAARTEVRMKDAGVDAASSILIPKLIETYIDKMDRIKKLGRSRRATLEMLAKTPFFDFPANKLTGDKLAEYAALRQTEGLHPATIMSNLVNLRGAFRDARPLLNIDLNDAVFEEWLPWMRRRGLVSASGIRTRRLQSGELERLRVAFNKRARHMSSLLPMSDIVEFAIASCMRQSEICRITWADLDVKAGTVWIRDRKNPQRSEDDLIPLTSVAMEIIQRQAPDSDRIFPYEPRSISAAFTRVAKQCGIDDLHFHDLRREGISLLIEAGLTAEEVATISGHKDLNILHQVYTAISPDHMRKRLAETGN